MLDNLNPTQADIKKESEKDQNQAQTDPAPGPVKDQARGSTTSSAHESFPGSAPEPKFGQAQSPNGTSNTTPRSRQSPTCAASTPGPNLETMKTPFVMKTPKFDSQLPIENWIYAMDIYMACYNLSEENIIKVSLAQLLTNDSGSSLIECFTPAELKSWNAFKSKLIAVLGKDQEHFKHLYNTFKRENESQAMALMKLTAFFKKGYKKYNIDEADQQIICEKFITAQKTRLMELLTREKSMLNLTNIAQRATEIERSLTTEKNAPVAVGKSKSKELCSLLEKMLDFMKTSE